ncbi:glycoside hydrolase [Xylariomycetidae sp. FL0641]|nr:glycoside hydrolase [Xylariomycetidae sp. FL0641]
MPPRRTRVLTGMVLLLFIYILSSLFYSRSPPRIRALVTHDVTYVQSSFDWSQLERRFPVPEEDITPLPRGKPDALPAVQSYFRPANTTRQQLLENRRQGVKHAFVKSWRSYKTRAWMYDELTPVSGMPKNTFGGWAATLVDALDTLWIMDLRDEFHDAVAAIATIDWSATDETACNFFETTIRHLGGLLSAHELSQEPVLLRKAVELGDMLL